MEMREEKCLSNIEFACQLIYLRFPKLHFQAQNPKDPKDQDSQAAATPNIEARDSGFSDDMAFEHGCEPRFAQFYGKNVFGTFGARYLCRRRFQNLRSQI
jgi:hypothetical protein